MGLKDNQKAIIIAAVMIISFFVLFSLFYIHVEKEVSFEVFEKLKGLFWGYSVQYKSGMIIIDNLFEAVSLSALYSVALGMLTYSVLFLIPFKNS